MTLEQLTETIGRLTETAKNADVEIWIEGEGTSIRSVSYKPARLIISISEE